MPQGKGRGRGGKTYFSRVRRVALHPLREGGSNGHRRIDGSLPVPSGEVDGSEVEAPYGVVGVELLGLLEERQGRVGLKESEEGLRYKGRTRGG